MRLPRLTAASVAASMLLVTGVAGCSSDDDRPDPSEVVVIAADLHDGSPVDDAYARALELRVEQINASGRLGDRKLQLRIEDNRADPTASLRNISTFADDPAVAAVVGGGCDSCVVGAAKTINDKRIPTIALAASDEITNPVADRQWVFKLGPNAADGAAAMVAELTRLKLRKVAVLYADDLYGKGARASLEDALGKAGITARTSRAVKPGATDVSQPVGALVADQPEALVVLTAPDQAQLAATDAKRAGYRGRVFFGAGAAGDLFIPPAAAGGVNDTTMVFTQILAIDDVVATTPAKS